MPDYQSMHLDDLLEQLEASDIVRELERFESLNIQRGLKEDVLVDYTPINTAIEIFSLLEIASMIRLVPEQLPDQVFSSLRAMYGSQLFLQLASSNPSGILLSSLYARTSGAFSLYDGDQECLSTFFQFSILSSGFRQDEAVLEFCRLMTNFSLNESLDHILRSPVAFVEAITQSRASHSLLSFMTGLSRFLILCHDFNDLLKELEQYPLIQSAYWHHNARIVHLPGDERLSRLLHDLEGWTELENNLLFQESSKVFLRNTSEAFEDLTGGLYQQELPKRITERMRSIQPAEDLLDISKIDEDSEPSPGANA